MSRSRILIVDDHPANLKLAEVVLAGEGFEVRTATDAVEALASIRLSPPDLILMDLQLPGMDGLELTRRLKADPATSRIVVLALTAYAMKGDEEKARAAGCDGYITKPIDTRTLARTIQVLLGTVPAGPRILVVDDEPLNRRLAEARLGLAGFVVTIASRPEAALEMARRDPPDAILSDILMPGLDGFQLCLAVRGDPAIGHLPVVLVSSSYAEEADRELARGVGANALVVRSPDFREAIEALAGVLRSGLPPPVPREAADLESAYRERLVWQLGRQVEMNADLRQRSALHAAALSVIGSLGQIVAQPSTASEILVAALIHCLAATRVSTGLLYVTDPEGHLRFHADSRLPAGTPEAARGAFGHPELLADVLQGGAPVAFDEPTAPPAARDVLEALGESSILIVPLSSLTARKAVLVLGSSAVSFDDATWLSFGHALASQLGQAVALGETLSRLAVSEARYRSLFEDAIEGFCRTTPDGRYLDANPALARIMGYDSPQELMETVTDIRSQVYIRGEERDRYMRDLEANGFVTGFEAHFRRKDGTTVWLRSSLRAKRGPNGEIVHIDGVVEDVTERRRDQQRLSVEGLVTKALAESESFEAALPRLLEGCGRILGWDVVEFFARESGHLRWVSSWSGSERAAPLVEAGRALVFASGVGLPGRVWAAAEPVWIEDLAGDESFCRASAATTAGLRTGAAFPVILQGEVLGVLDLLSHDSRPRDPALVSLFDGIGSQIGQFIQRKKVEEALHRQALILENLHDAVSVADLAGHIIDWNRGAEALYGYTRREVLGRRHDFLFRDDAAVTPRTIGASVLSDGSWSGEIPFVRKDGKGGFIDLVVLPLRDSAGGVVATFAVARDITERRLLEEQFRQAQKMEAVGRLAGGIAHDFNNILTAILGYSDLLSSRLTDPGALGDVEEIRAAGERAAALTRQLLAFSRKQVIVPQILDLNTVTSGMDRMLRPLIGEDVDLAWRLDPSLGRVEADRGQIEQVIMNLAVNARDAMPRGGKLTIETANVELDEAYTREHVGAKPGPHVMLAMSDTGIGMDASVQEHVFEPFFTTKEAGKGTGLGLATVYGIVKQARGSIWLYSESGRGTSFKIYLPLVEKAAGAAATTATAATNAVGGTEHILVAEDEEPLRRLVRVMLEKNGYRVSEAGDGDEAWATLSAGAPPDLLLSDTVMPGLAVGSLLERLAGTWPETRVLLMSGYTDEAALRHGMRDEGTPFLQKPFTTDGLLRKVREVLDRRRVTPGS